MTFLRHFAVALAAGLLAAPAFSRSVQPPDQGEGTAVKVLTYNIQWCNYYDLDGNLLGNSCDHIVDVIRHHDADFVALQEVRNTEQAELLAEALGMNLHFGYALDGSEGNPIGNAILTPHPILESHTHMLPHLEWQKRNMVEILSEIDGQAIRVFSCHLTFNARPDKPLHYNAMMDVIAQRSEPRILMGDFNDMDDRPNEYSPYGFLNIVTGAGHGTILPAVPKMFDFHRKTAIDSQVHNDPPYYSLRTDWDPPAQEANTVSGWEHRVRIDYIFVSPEFYLDAPGNRAWSVDTRELTPKLYPGKDPFVVSDHRPVYAEVLLPKPVEQLFLNPQEGPTVLAVGESRVIHVGGVDAAGSPVSLLRTDHEAPLGDPARTARIIDGVTWSFEGEGGELTPVDPLEGYNPYIRHHRPSSGKVRFTATEEGTGVLRAAIDGVEATLDIKVVPEGTRYTHGM